MIRIDLDSKKGIDLSPKAIAHYHIGDLTAKGLLRFWVRIRLAEGWSTNINPKELRQQLGMKRSTFWAALGKLKEEGEIDWQEPTNLKITPLSQKIDTSKILDKSPKK